MPVRMYSGKYAGVRLGHVGLARLTRLTVHPAERLAADLVQQQARRGEAVLRLGLDVAPGRHHQRELDLVLRDAVVTGAEGLVEDQLGVDRVEAVGRLRHDHAQPVDVQRCGAAVGGADSDRGPLGDTGWVGRGAGLGALLSVEDVRAGNLVLAGAHQRQLDLVLDVLDLDAAAGVTAAGQGVDDPAGQVGHQVADPVSGAGLGALDGEERLGHGDRDLGMIERGAAAVAADDGQLAALIGRCGLVDRHGSRRSG